MVFEIRFLAGNIPVIVDSNKQYVPFIVLQSVRILLTFDLPNRSFRILIVFQLYYQSGFITVSWRR